MTKMVEKLHLPKEKLMDWAMPRLSAACKSAKPSWANVRVIQNVAIWYCWTGIRQHGRMSTEEKWAQGARSYRGFIVPAFLKWLKEEYDFAPPWLTEELMGKTTLTDGETLWDMLWCNTDRTPKNRVDVRSIAFSKVTI